ncbi:MAG: FN3 associated domain-containing protein, partial [Clostridia bacterium]
NVPTSGNYDISTRIYFTNDLLYAGPYEFILVPFGENALDKTKSLKSVNNFSATNGMKTEKIGSSIKLEAGEYLFTYLLDAANDPGNDVAFGKGRMDYGYFADVTLTPIVDLVAAKVYPANGATFTDSMKVKMSAAAGAEIYYTTDGSDMAGGTGGTKYDAATPLVVTADTIVKTQVRKDGKVSDVTTNSYKKVVATTDPLTYNFCVLAPQASGSSGMVPVSSAVDYAHVIAKSNAATSIKSSPWCYRAEKDPTNKWAFKTDDTPDQWSFGVVLAGNQVPDKNWGAVNINVPTSGTYNIDVRYMSTTLGGPVKYFITSSDNANPIDEAGYKATVSNYSTKYEQTVKPVIKKVQLEAGEHTIAFECQNAKGEVAGTQGQYLWISQIILTPDVVTPTEPVVAPVSSVANGSTFAANQEITFTSTTPDAKIYYTVNGTEPTATNGILYTAPFSILATTTIKAIAVKDGMIDSAVTKVKLFKFGPDDISPFHPDTPLVYDKNMTVEQSAAPTVDGNIADWTLSKDMVTLEGAAAPAGNKFDLKWDANKLYIAANIKRAGAPVAGTKISFFIDPTAHKSQPSDIINDSGKTGVQLGDVQIIVTFDANGKGKATVAAGTTYEYPNAAAIAANSVAYLKANSAGDGFVVEASLNWADLMIKPIVGEYFAFNLFDENDLAWSKNISGFANQTNAYGKVTLAAAPVAPVAPYDVLTSATGASVVGTTHAAPKTTSDGQFVEVLKAAEDGKGNPSAGDNGVEVTLPDGGIDITNLPCAFFDFEADGNAEVAITLFYTRKDTGKTGAYQIIDQFKGSNGNPYLGGAVSDKFNVFNYFNQNDSYRARLDGGKLMVTHIIFKVKGDKGASARLKRLVFDKEDAVYPNLTPVSQTPAVDFLDSSSVAKINTSADHTFTANPNGSLTIKLASAYDGAGVFDGGDTGFNLDTGVFGHGIYIPVNKKINFSQNPNFYFDIKTDGTTKYAIGIVYDYVKTNVPFKHYAVSGRYLEATGGSGLFMAGDINKSFNVLTDYLFNRYGTDGMLEIKGIHLVAAGDKGGSVTFDHLMLGTRELTFNPIPVTPGNLITKAPGFEDGSWGIFDTPAVNDTDKSGQRQIDIATIAKDGNASNKALHVKFDPTKSREINGVIQGQAQLVSLPADRVTLAPGKLYEYSYWVKLENHALPAANPNNGFILFGSGMNMYKNTTGVTGSDMFLDLARAEDMQVRANFPACFGEWTKITHFIAAPITAAVYATPRITLDVRNIADIKALAGFGGDFYFDDFSIKEVKFDAVSLALDKTGDLQVGTDAVMTITPTSDTKGEIRLTKDSLATAVSFTNTDPTVATVSAAEPLGPNKDNSPTIAKITPIKAGSTTITAKVVIDGVEKTAQTVVTVAAPVST